MLPYFLNVLLVEDDPSFVARVKRSFEDDEGPIQVQIMEASRVEEARKRLSSCGMDAILLDLSLPDGAGIESIEKILPYSRGLPLIVLTGLDDEHIGVEAVRRGAQEDLVKGKTATEIPALLLHAVERRRKESRKPSSGVGIQKEIQLLKGLAYSPHFLEHGDSRGKGFWR